MSLFISVTESLSTHDAVKIPLAMAKSVTVDEAMTLSINVPDSLSTKDNLGTYKPWFNGMKHFYTVKPLPPEPKQNNR
ncbi:MAG TPA: hypothetical protein VJC09_01595 [Candidatus Saccharimonadales bacterium]|nr:hypothetical protein [Candidatus Saccharimonadales bacterium]